MLLPLQVPQMDLSGIPPNEPNILGYHRSCIFQAKVLMESQLWRLCGRALMHMAWVTCTSVIYTQLLSQHMRQSRQQLSLERLGLFTMQTHRMHRNYNSIPHANPQLISCIMQEKSNVFTSKATSPSLLSSLILSECCKRDPAPLCWQ